MTDHSRAKHGPKCWQVHPVCALRSARAQLLVRRDALDAEAAAYQRAERSTIRIAEGLESGSDGQAAETVRRVVAARKLLAAAAARAQLTTPHRAAVATSAVIGVPSAAPEVSLPPDQPGPSA